MNHSKKRQTEITDIICTLVSPANIASLLIPKNRSTYSAFITYVYRELINLKNHE